MVRLAATTKAGCLLTLCLKQRYLSPDEDFSGEGKHVYTRVKRGTIVC